MKKALVRCHIENENDVHTCHVECKHDKWHTVKEHNASKKFCSQRCMCLSRAELKQEKAKTFIENKGW